jgi:hypothetical protein
VKLRLTIDEDLVDNSKRVLGVVEVVHLTLDDDQALLVKPRPFHSVHPRSVVVVSSDKAESLLTESERLDMYVFSVPEVMDCPSTVVEDTEVLHRKSSQPIARKCNDALNNVATNNNRAERQTWNFAWSSLTYRCREHSDASAWYRIMEQNSVFHCYDDCSVQLRR